MRRVLLIICLFLLSGCVGDRTGGAVWWNPTTWASRMAPAKADRAGEQLDEAKLKEKEAAEKVIAAAQREFAKSGEMLTHAPDGREVTLARRFNSNGLSLMAQVRPLTAEESLELRSLVDDLLSEKADVAARAELRQARIEMDAAVLGRKLAEAEDAVERRAEALTKANANLREAYDRENALANQVRNFWFIAIGLLLLFVVSNVLAAVAKVYPPLAPVSRAINGVVSPALAFAEARATAGLQRVGRAIKVMKEKAPDIADRVVEVFDQETDEDHQRVIGSEARK